MAVRLDGIMVGIVSAVGNATRLFVGLIRLLDGVSKKTVTCSSGEGLKTP